MALVACSGEINNRDTFEEIEGSGTEEVENIENFEVLVWPKNQLGTLIPIPTSIYGVVQHSSEDELRLLINQVSQEKFYEYVSACFEKGFSIIKTESSSEFHAVNQEGYQVKLQLSDKDMYITVSEPLYKIEVTVDCLQNIFFNQYDIVVNLDGVEVDFISHGGEDTFVFELEKGPHTLEIVKKNYITPKGTTTIDVTENAAITYYIYCNEDNIKVEQEKYISMRPLKESEARTPAPATDFKYKDYKDVERALKNAGFTNIKTAILYDIVWGWTVEGEVASVSIDGDKDFTNGTIFDKTAEVVITYHMKEEDDPNRPVGNETEKTEDNELENNEKESSGEDDTNIEETPVYYSTNTQATVDNGNTGVYSYKNKGGSYDNYWIIDFDKGYVYNFLDGNGDEHCERLKIESGDLNSVLIITYHDGGLTWSYGLHFKYVDHPEHLILQDNNGFEYDFYPTNLSKALVVRGEKTIKDY